MPPSRPAQDLILVVEDDSQTRELFRTALRDAGYLVAVVGDGLNALRFLEQRTPAAVVLDLGLPILSGRDVRREMSADFRTQQVPVVVVTADPGEIDESDFACVLRKPIDAHELLTAVDRCVRGRGWII